MTRYEELLEILDNGDPEEWLEAELEILGKLIYYKGD